jgi:histidinol-phosphate aminotransferase
MTFERNNIAAMQGYSYGEQPSDEQTLKLNTNESPFPPSPAVQQALSSFDASSLRIYPNATADALRDRLAVGHGVNRSNIVMTHGGDEALRLALTTFVAPGAAFGMAEPSYSLYPVLAQVQDARVVPVKLNSDWQLPVDAAETWNQQGVELTCLVNPHAPSGTLAATAELDTLASQLNGLLLIDEAYADFVDPQAQYQSTALLKKHNNILILRTFSKGYGLAGLRLGYLLGNAELIKPVLEKTRDSYNIDHISQALGAAAYADQEYAQQTWAEVRAARAELAAGLGQLGFTMPDSQTNFLLVTPASSASAKDLYEGLKAKKILVRYFATPGLDNKLRITVGTRQQNQQLIEAIGQLMV